MGIWRVLSDALRPANRGDMKEVMRVIAGKPTMAGLDAVWPDIHGDQQMADFEVFKEMLLKARQ